MAISAKDLGIDKLPIDDRIALVEEIWESIRAEKPSLPLTDAQKAELDRRLVDYEANPHDVISWEEVEASILARLSG